MNKLIDYVHRLNAIQYDFEAILRASEQLFNVWLTKHQVFICGNGVEEARDADQRLGPVAARPPPGQYS